MLRSEWVQFTIIILYYKKITLWFDLIEIFFILKYNLDSNTKCSFIWLKNALKDLLKWNYNESLAGSLLEILCYSRSLCVLWMFLVCSLFSKICNGSFSGGLEAQIHKTSLI